MCPGMIEAGLSDAQPQARPLSWLACYGIAVWHAAIAAPLQCGLFRQFIEWLFSLAVAYISVVVNWSDPDQPANDLQ